ncbi:MAG: universal stress protein [Chloroflexi bacterium]|nr:universal stress protein [Chloroflexota bacterium]OJW01881.1 MAG: hypothetical protein BGO39_28450 [Chloroflexi bacterium 54-19]
MISRIAVALDGSSLSESSLPYIYYLAKLLNAKLLLLQVSFWPEDTTGAIYMDSEAGISPANYLTGVKAILTDPASPWQFQPDEVQTKVVYKKSVLELGDVALAEGADLLVMTTHGRSGLSLLIMGSIAKSILKHTRLPVILMRPEETPLKAQAQIEAILANPPAPLAVATLDGSLEAEACLGPASEICAQLDIPLYLLEVVSPSLAGLIGTMGLSYSYNESEEQKEIQKIRKEATTYLEQVAHHLQDVYPHLKVEVTVLVGNPAKQIEDFTGGIHPLFVAMATHARGDFGQMLPGSVAEKIVRKSRQPVLLARVPRGYRGFNLSMEEGKNGMAEDGY